MLEVWSNQEQAESLEQAATMPLAHLRQKAWLRSQMYHLCHRLWLLNDFAADSICCCGSAKARWWLKLLSTHLVVSAPTVSSDGLAAYSSNMTL